MTATNPHHGYLTEPRWFTARNKFGELSLRRACEIAAMAAAAVVVIMIIAG